MAKLIDMSLDDLYARPKITPAVFKAIVAKEDFSGIRERFCDKVCQAPCYMKNPSEILLQTRTTDIMVVQRHPAMDDLWKNGEQMDSIFESIMAFTFQRVLANRQVKDRLTNREPSWRIHHALKCRPIAENRSQRDAIPFGERKPLPANPTLTATAIQKCTPYLMDEIRQSRPKVIISTCTMSTKALGFKHISNYKNRGWIQILEIDDMRIPVVFTLHPEVTTMIRQNASGQMWGPDYYSVIERDFDKAAAIACGEFTPRDLDEALKEIEDNLQITVTDSLESVKREMGKIKALSGTRTIISWDTETSGLDPWAENAKFLTHQFGYTREDGKVQALVIPLWHKDNTFYNPDEAWEYVKEVLEDSGIPKVAHNAAFDLKYTRVVKGVDVQNVIADTMLLLHAINSGISGNYSLKTAVWDFLPETGLGGYEDELDASLLDLINVEVDE